ncbi:hypothetical protein [Vibrio tritonius]|nr:hypothetical protein [Vibrio tritonius]
MKYRNTRTNNQGIERIYPNDLKMQTSELHQRAQVKLNYGRNGYSLST